jgi:hypothetical protein
MKKMNNEAPVKLEREILALLKERDDSVRQKDHKKFLATQIREIEFSDSDGYMQNDYQESDLLYLYPHGKNQPTCVAFVKEEYFKDGKKVRHNFLIYYFTKTDEGWKVSNIAH